MTSTLVAAVQALRAVPRSLDSYRSASDVLLLELRDLAGEARRLADVHLALVAGEIEHRSAAELGGAGLARRSGARTTEELLKATTGLTGRDAAVAVRVGRLTQNSDGMLGTRVLGTRVLGTRVLGTRVLDGSVSVAAAESIRAGLDGVTDVEPELLTQASELLCAEAQHLDPDQLMKRAREVRDELDEAGIADREAVLRSRRSIRRIDLRDGMKRIIWDYDPLSAGVIDEVYDRATSPRRGGVQFVDAEMAARAARIADDPRTVEQLASDAFTELLRHAASVDSDVLVGSGTPAVRVIVPADTLSTRVGHGVIEGTNEPLSIHTVETLACANGIQPIRIDADGQILDLGREQRLYTRHQRIALAVRDGGCLWTNCDRPPSWAEAHHIDHWQHGGKTDLARGVLLCRHHHLRLHNEGWTIRLKAGRYWLEPPPETRQPATLLTTKSRAMREHLTRPTRASAVGARATVLGSRPRIESS